jgi:hypothetical protein
MSLREQISSLIGAKRILIKGHVEYEAGYNPAAALISENETFKAHWGFDGKY